MFIFRMASWFIINSWIWTTIQIFFNFVIKASVLSDIKHNNGKVEGGFPPTSGQIPPTSGGFVWLDCTPHMGFICRSTNIRIKYWCRGNLFDWYHGPIDGTGDNLFLLTYDLLKSCRLRCQFNDDVSGIERANHVSVIIGPTTVNDVYKTLCRYHHVTRYWQCP